MSFAARRVLIPLASAKAGEGRIAHIRADGEKPANDAKLIPEIALLNDCRLYRAGEVAASSIRELGVRQDKFVTRFGWHRRAYLSAVNASDLRGLASNNSASAELGLALGMLMYEGQSEATLVIATGELAPEEGLRLPQDAPVKPVGHMSAKIEALRTYLDDHIGAAIPPRVTFFFPASTPEGEETLSTHRDQLEHLVAAYREHGVELSLQPVSSLREAFSVLKIKGPGLDPVYKRVFGWSLRGAFALGVVLILAGLFQLWLAKPIQLEFADMALAGGERAPSPLPVMATADGGMQALASCHDAAGRAIYPANKVIAFRATVRNPRSFTDWLVPYRFVVIAISEKSGVKVFAPILPEEAGDDRDLPFAVSIKDVEESNKLIILARRGAAFDTRKLQTRLSALVARTPQSDRINAVANAVAAEAPGYLDYLFLTQKEPLPCL